MIISMSIGWQPSWETLNVVAVQALVPRDRPTLAAPTVIATEIVATTPAATPISPSSLVPSSVAAASCSASTCWSSTARRRGRRPWRRLEGRTRAIRWATHSQTQMSLVSLLSSISLLITTSLRIITIAPWWTTLICRWSKTKVRTVVASLRLKSSNPIFPLNPEVLHLFQKPRRQPPSPW